MNRNQTCLRRVGDKHLRYQKIAKSTAIMGGIEACKLSTSNRRADPHASRHPQHEARGRNGCRLGHYLDYTLI